MVLCFVTATWVMAEVVKTTEDGGKTLVLTQQDGTPTIGDYINENLTTLQEEGYNKIRIVGAYGTSFTPLNSLGIPYIDLTEAKKDTWNNDLDAMEKQVTNGDIKGIVAKPGTWTFSRRTDLVKDLIQYFPGDHSYEKNGVYANYPDEATAELANDNVLKGFFEAFPNATVRTLEVKGNIGVNDLGYLNAEIVDMSSATMSGTIDDIAGTEKYLMLPNNFAKATNEDGTTTGDAVLLSSISKTNNPNLLVVGSVAEADEQEEWIYTQKSGEVTTQTKDRKILSVYQTEQNHVSGFVGAFVLGSTAYDKLCMAGLYGDKDLVGPTQWDQNAMEPLFKKDDLHYFDFTGATFDEDVTVNLSSSTYGKYTQESETCTTTNAFYYLSYYNTMTCVLPTGNTKIPPQVFNTNNEGWTSPLAEITIPEGYTEIGFEAFFASHISKIVLPSTMSKVGVGAFAAYGKDAGVLTEMEMQPNTAEGGCTFGAGAFANQDKLKHASLSEGVNNISANMFDQCWQLESIRIPTTCKVIDSQAFNLCKSLHEVTIPEGVESINFEAFEGAGLTDLYIMAKSICTLPKIYAMSVTGEGPSSFTPQRVSGNNTVPQTHAVTAKGGDGSISDAEWDEVITWYQDELSGEGGLGTGNCLTMLHYPDEMKWFYEGIDMQDFIDKGYVTEDDLDNCVYGWHPAETEGNVTGWVDYTSNPSRVTDKINGIHYDGPGMPDGLSNLTSEEFMGEKYNKIVSLPYAYGVISGNDYVYMGPDADGKYYPSQDDYAMRLAAGATDGTSAGQTASAWGWRQFPLATGVAAGGEYTYEKEYDNTWYTMCFPWRMDDNHLFYAFNQKCEIAEFVGVEMLDTDDPETEKVIEYSLVFHFDKTAPTYYMDANNVEYSREEELVNGEPRVNSAGNKYYIYTSIADGTVVRAPNPWPESMKNASAEVREQAGKYLGIENVMVLPGHPYMIHPSIGAAPGHPAKVYMNGIKKVEVGKDTEEKTFEYASYAELAEANKVGKVVTTDGSFNTGVSGTATWFNPEDAEKHVSTYYFWGNIDDYDEDATVKGKDMLDLKEYPVAYYLGAAIDNGGASPYPKYYKKVSGGIGKWSQYTAIIRPDKNAQDWCEGIDGMLATDKTTGTNVAFGAWEQVEATAIQDIIAEAEANNQEVKEIHLNVVFNVNGQVVRNNSTSVEGLPKGLYIVNGKKYMVK